VFWQSPQVRLLGNMRYATLSGINPQFERSPFLQSVRCATQQRHYSISTVTSAGND